MQNAEQFLKDCLGLQIRCVDGMLQLLVQNRDASGAPVGDPVVISETSLTKTDTGSPLDDWTPGVCLGGATSVTDADGNTTGDTYHNVSGVLFADIPAGAQIYVEDSNGNSGWFTPGQAVGGPSLALSGNELTAAGVSKDCNDWTIVNVVSGNDDVAPAGDPTECDDPVEEVVPLGTGVRSEDKTAYTLDYTTADGGAFYFEQTDARLINFNNSLIQGYGLEPLSRDTPIKSKISVPPNCKAVIKFGYFHNGEEPNHNSIEFSGPGTVHSVEFEAGNSNFAYDPATQIITTSQEDITSFYVTVSGDLDFDIHYRNHGEIQGFTLLCCPPA